jgi:predicted negative regulator of RcsB-dependent stress response
MTAPLIETEGWSFFDWIQANTRAITIGAAVLAVGAAGLWFYMRSAEIKRANAERQLNQAKQSLQAGNQALAQSDLQRVASRYKGTPAGAQAAMLLAQVEFAQGKWNEGLAVLDGYTSERAAGPHFAAVLSMVGDGQLGAGRPADAAASYRRAADATSMAGEKTMFLAKAARTYQASGNDAEAKAIWERLAADPEAPVRSEAQVRLGELTVRPAT